MQKMKTRCGDIALYAMLTTFLYVGTLSFTGFVSGLLQPKITTQSKLEQMLEMDRKKLDASNNVMIRAALSQECIGKSTKLGDGLYEISLGGIHANESTLKHELYHILDGHFEDAENLNSELLTALKYLFWYEPKARIYELTGLKP